jgi:Fe-Mn family superoxide dismutase
MTRRDALKVAGASAAALMLSPLAIADEKKAAGFTLPPLPYPYDALEPHIDTETMKIHHDRHHKAYVDNLNKALAEQPNFLGMSVEDVLRQIGSLPKDIRQAVVNNGGGHANHSMFWLIMTKNGGGKPSGALAKAIDDSFGTFEDFQKKLSDSAVKRFGSGWGWLVLSNGKLEVLSTGNQDSPIMKGQKPIMGIDVWEHAYYLKYQNKRPDYVKAWWNTVNWDNVAERYDKAVKEG